MHALLELGEVVERRIDVAPELANEAQAHEAAEHEAQRVPERGARLRLVRERHHRERRAAAEVSQLAARREHEHLRPAPLRLAERRERLLRVARVRRADHERVPSDERGQTVIAVDRHRHLELLGEERRGEVAADRRSAHPRERDVAHVPIRRRERRIARDRPRIPHLLPQVLDAIEHVRGIGGANSLHRLDDARVDALHRASHR